MPDAAPRNHPDYLSKTEKQSKQKNSLYIIKCKT